MSAVISVTMSDCFLRCAGGSGGGVFLQVFSSTIMSQCHIEAVNSTAVGNSAGVFCAIVELGHEWLSQMCGAYTSAPPIPPPPLYLQQQSPPRNHARVSRTHAHTPLCQHIGPLHCVDTYWGGGAVIQ
jgi:hypothetical protein